MFLWPHQRSPNPSLGPGKTRRFSSPLQQFHPLPCQLSRRRLRIKPEVVEYFLDHIRRFNHRNQLELAAARTVLNVNVEYALPAELITGKKQITVRFQAHDKNMAGGLYYMSVMKK